MLKSHNTVPYRPSRRHLTLACGIWPCCATTPTLRHGRFFFLLPLPLSIDLLPGIWNEPWCSPPPLPSSVPVAGSFEIAWFGFRFPRFCSFATL